LSTFCSTIEGETNDEAFYDRAERSAAGCPEDHAVRKNAQEILSRAQHSGFFSRLAREVCQATILLEDLDLSGEHRTWTHLASEAAKEFGVLRTQF